MERILDQNHLIMVNVRQVNEQSYANAFEWHVFRLNENEEEQEAKDCWNF